MIISDLGPKFLFPQAHHFQNKMSNGVRGKYAKQYHKGVKLIMLDADVAEIFPDAKSVNEALRTLSKVILQHQKTA